MTQSSQSFGSGRRQRQSAREQARIGAESALGSHRCLMSADCRRTTLRMRPAAGCAQPGFHLRRGSILFRKQIGDRRSRRHRKSVMMHQGWKRRSIGAAIQRSMKGRLSARLRSHCHNARTVMLPIAAAAGRQIHLTARRRSKKRDSHRQPKHSQQQDGYKSPQHSD